MNAQDIITQLTDTANKVTTSNPQARVNPAQLGQLAGAMQQVLHDCGIVKTNDLIDIRKAIQGMVAGVEIKSSKDLPYGMVIAMVSRWTCGLGAEYEPTDECVREIPILMRELAIRNGQGELL